MKRKAGPFPLALPCESTEVARSVHEDCLACKAKGKEARAKAKAAHLAATDRTDASPSLIQRILDHGERVFGEQRGSFVPISRPTAAVVGEKIRPGPPNRANRSRPFGQRRSKATSGIPTIVVTDLGGDAEPTVKPQPSWATGDDLHWQEEPSEVVRQDPLPPPPSAPVSHLDSLPSQAIHPLRQNPPDVYGQTGRKQVSATPQQRVKAKPLPQLPAEALNQYATELLADIGFPTREESIHAQDLPASTSSYLAYSAKEQRQVRQATLEAILATDVDDRHSRADEQSTELFFSGDYTAGQYHAQTLGTLHGGRPSQAPKEVLRTPTILRAGQKPTHSQVYEPAFELFVSPGSSDEVPARIPTVLRPGRPDSTYKIPTVGQIPSHFSTVTHRAPATANAADLKTSHRHAKLSASQEAMWGSVVSGLAPTLETKAETAPQLPQLPSLPPLSAMGKPQSKESIRMSSRISRPGLHDFYTKGGNTHAKAAIAELPALAGTRWGLSAEPTQQGQVPRLRRQETRQFRLQTGCAWDELVLQACASRDTLSTTRF